MIRNTGRFIKILIIILVFSIFITNESIDFGLKTKQGGERQLRLKY